MANVLFKRGLQANLPSTSAAVVDGAFYLTTDTNRLYVGQAGGTLKLLNQTVQIVADIASLPTFGTTAEVAAHVNDFYYCAGDNVLCVWKENANNSDNYGWQQINKNTDTTLNNLEYDSSVNNSTGTITTTITDTKSHTVTANFAINVAGGLSVATSGTNGLTITGKEYNLSRTVNENVATISLGNSVTATTDDVIFRAGDNVTLSTTGTSGITISAINHVINNAELSIPSNGYLAIEVTDTGSHSASATLANVGIAVGSDSSKFLPIVNTSGKSAATVYTQAEIDNLLKGLNGMTYKGTIAKNITATVNSLPTTNVENGWVYVVTEDGLTANDLGSITAATISTLSEGTRVGDMLIAVGEEGSDGKIPSANVQWTYIPAGNDELGSVTYHSNITTATNVIELANSSGAVALSLGLTAGTDIAISSSSVADSNEMISTISHGTITTTTSTTAISAATSLPVVSSLTVNNGHVTAFQTTEYTPITYQLHESRASTTCAGDVINGTRMVDGTNSGNNDISFATTLATETGSLITSSLIKLSSSTIKLSKGNSGEVVMNMEWGTF